MKGWDGRTTISQREMRNNSGEVLRRVAAGETFVVTNNGHPAAVLQPVSTPAYDTLLRGGQLTLPERPLDLAALSPRVAPRVPTRQLLDEDRGDR